MNTWVQRVDTELQITKITPNAFEIRKWLITHKNTEDEKSNEICDDSSLLSYDTISGSSLPDPQMLK